MRQEIQRVKEILQKAAGSARLYHERIEHIRKTCKPEVIMQETKEYAGLLNEAMEKAREEITAQFSALETNIKHRMMIDAKDYNKDTVELVNLLVPDADELEAIAKQFEGNETMLRFFHKYRDDHQLTAALPLCGADRIKELNRMKNDITYTLAFASEPTSATNKYGDSYLQHFVENFDDIFGNQMQVIGD